MVTQQPDFTHYEIGQALETSLEFTLTMCSLNPRGITCLREAIARVGDHLNWTRRSGSQEEPHWENVSQKC